MPVIKDHNDLFVEPVYQDQFAAKREFENACAAERVEEVAAWTKSHEYRELNFAREAVSINPAKACQPLGAVLAALGFARTLPFVQGSQGCTAYFRSYFSRHFKEPIATVSTSMTEDAAVFGGLSNMIEGLENAYALYRPDMMAVSTTCMAEVIGDDLQAYIKQAKSAGSIPADLLVAYAHTPSFVGSHLNGFDVMLRGILEALAQPGEPNGKLNVICGFDGYAGNLREVRRMLDAMGVEHVMLADYSDVVDAGNTGVYELYPDGGTALVDAADAVNASATIALQRWSTVKTGELIEQEWGQTFSVTWMPVGVRATDAFLSEVCRLTGAQVPTALEAERARAVDAYVDSHPYLHDKRLALVGDPDLLLGLISFALELGMRPVHIVCTNGDKRFKRAAEGMLAASPFGQDATVWIKKDLWHLRSLMFTEPVDLLVGPSTAKFLWKDTGTPFIRVGFPLFDRHHLHKRPIVGYEGALNLLTDFVNTVLDELDRKAIACSSPSFDLIR